MRKEDADVWREQVLFVSTLSSSNTVTLTLNLLSRPIITRNSTVRLSTRRPSPMATVSCTAGSVIKYAPLPSDKSTTAQSYTRTKSGRKVASFSFVTSSRNDPIALSSTLLISSPSSWRSCSRYRRSNTSRKNAKIGLMSEGRAFRSEFLSTRRSKSKKPDKT